MGAAIGELVVALVAGGGLVISGIVLIAVSKYQIKKYALSEKADGEVPV